MIGYAESLKRLEGYTTANGYNTYLGSFVPKQKSERNNEDIVRIYLSVNDRGGLMLPVCFWVQRTCICGPLIDKIPLRLG